MPVQQNCDTILTMVDKATKMCHFIACNEKISAREVARLYWQHVGRLHSIPSVIISDRDVRFTSRFWRELWRILGTDLRMGSGFHPESSGQVEKFNQLLEQTLRCTVHQMGEGRNWIDMLPVIEFSINNTPNRTTGYSAFYLNYGFHPLHPLQLVNAPTDSYVENVVSFVSRLQGDFDRAQRQLNESQGTNGATRGPISQGIGISSWRPCVAEHSNIYDSTIVLKSCRGGLWDRLKSYGRSAK